MKIQRPAIFLLCILLSLFLALPLSAQADSIVIDEDALFADDDQTDAGLVIIPQEEKGKAVSSFLKSETVRIGGNYSGSVGGVWKWDDPWHEQKWPSAALKPQADALLFFDARPSEGSRYYGSVKATLPYTIISSVSTSSQANLQIFELFSDFTWKDHINFRFGKHTVKWGVGYYWSPADIINLSAIDVQNPEAQREGPISLRVHVPIPKTQNNIWAYAIMPRFNNVEELQKARPEDIALAAKAEFLLGDYEIGIGTHWQRDDFAPKAMLTATGSIWKFNVFGEAVLGWGITKIPQNNLAQAIADSSKIEKNKDTPYFQSTLGGMYNNSTHKISTTAQYFFNGKTYTDRERKNLINEARSILANPMFINLMQTKGIDSNLLLPSLIAQTGRHYLGLSFSKQELFVKNFSVSIFSLNNLSDLSGMVQPNFSWKFFDQLSLSVAPTFFWSTDALWGAGKNAEYVVLNDGPAISLSVTAKLGGGSF